MKRYFLYWLIWMAVGLSVWIAGNVHAVDTLPPIGTVPGTIPGPVVEPVRHRVYCPLHVLEWSSDLGD